MPADAAKPSSPATRITSDPADLRHLDADVRIIEI
jgi:hypothetical protein